MRLANFKYIIASFIISFVVFVIAGEIIARNFGAKNAYEYDQELGWSPKKNFSFQQKVVDQSGEEYLADYSTNELGFREFGDLDSGKKRILFIGDSWTGDPNTSDDEAYFGFVKKSLPVEVFAFGGGGYGTLQELIMVKKIANLIKPDIFVLQHCDNDIVNNSFFLEGGRIVRNQKNFRPYWVENQTQYRLSTASFYVFLYKHSRLFRSLDSILTTLQFRIFKSYYPPRYQFYDGTTPAPSPELQAKIIAEKKSAIAVTEFLMKEMKSSLPAGTKLITFPASADESEAFLIWQTLAENTGFIPYPSVATKVEEAEKNGATVRVQDGAHWNRLGNKIAGEELVKILLRDFL